MVEGVPRPKKRLFLALILVSLLLVILATYGLWMVSFPGLANISVYLPFALGIVLITMLCALASGVVGILLAMVGIRTWTVFQGLVWSAINVLFPLALRLGALFDIDKERVECSFIEVSNHLVRQRNIKVRPDKLLILTPHCIQQDTCPYKITRDVENCRACGKCQVGELIHLSQTLGVHLAIVTGGTLARKVIKTLKPQAVLAIACERDLTSGIQDVFPLPVIGVLNERPFGPCCNTRIDMQRVEKAVKELIT